jgi:hypothetical protein
MLPPSSEGKLSLTGRHLWEANDGALRPLLPGQPLTGNCEQDRLGYHAWADLARDLGG